MKNVYGHLQKIKGETILTVSAQDSITVQCSTKSTNVAAIRLPQTDGVFYRNMLTGLESNFQLH